MITYDEFKNSSKKEVDAWAEVFIFHTLATPFGYLIYRLFNWFKPLPYLLTLSHFILKMASAVCFYYGHWVIAPILFFIASMIDNFDGKISRTMYGKDPDSRGILDYLFDCTSLFFILAGMTTYLFKTGLTLQAELLMGAMILLGLFFAYGSAKFRLYAINGYNPNQPMANVGKTLIRNPIMSLLFIVQTAARKLGIPFYPSMVEAEMLIILVFPFLVNHIWLLVIANLIIILDLVASSLLHVILIMRGSM